MGLVEILLGHVQEKLPYFGYCSVRASFPSLPVLLRLGREGGLGVRLGGLAGVFLVFLLLYLGFDGRASSLLVL